MARKYWDGLFSQGVLVSDNHYGRTTIIAGDIDLDGDLDVFTQGLFPAKVGWFENGVINPHHIQGQIYYDIN